MTYRSSLAYCRLTARGNAWILVEEANLAEISPLVEVGWADVNVVERLAVEGSKLMRVLLLVGNWLELLLRGGEDLALAVRGLQLIVHAKLRAKVFIHSRGHRVPRALLQDVQLRTNVALSNILLIHDVDRIPRLQLLLALSNGTLH